MRHDDRVEIRATGVELTRLGLGTAPLGGLFDAVDGDEARAVVAAALDAGVRWLDTAPLYGIGRSERLVGDVLRARPRESFALSTKVGRLLRPRGVPGSDLGALRTWVDPPPLAPVFDFSADGVVRSLEESLGRLGLDRVDVVFVHDPDRHMEQAIGQALPALVRLRDEGVVGAIGAGMNDAALLARLVRAADLDCVLLAGRWTLLDRRGGDELLPLCADRDVAVVCGGVFNSGVLAGGSTFDYRPAPPELLERVRRLRECAARAGVALEAPALQFPLRDASVAAVLAGARSTAELAADVAAFDLEVPPELWGELGA